jgi:anaerobic magnesium-protoporphyrin IX monomethyl ester cyclase
VESIASTFNRRNSIAADRPGDNAYACVRPSGSAPITAGYFLPRLRATQRYRLGDNHGVYRLCESIGANQPTTTGVDAERVHRTVAAAIEFINYKRSRGGKPTQLFVDEEVLRSGLVSIDGDGIYRLASLRDFESLTRFAAAAQ